MFVGVVGVVKLAVDAEAVEKVVVKTVVKAVEETVEKVG
jgi:hypothetical protein